MEPSAAKDLLLENIEATEESKSLLLWLVDPGRLVIFLVSLFLIHNGSQRAVKLDQESHDNPMTEGVQDLTWYHVMCMPFVGSIMLLILFYFFEYIQFFYMILCIIVSVTAFMNFIHPVLQQVLSWLQDKYRLRVNHLSLWSSGGVSAVIATTWVLTGHWLCLDALGMALCVLMIQFIRVPSLKLSTILLCGLLLYDIFWVFYSSSIFDANVMVEVAVKRADNPVAIVAEKLNLPEVAKSRPSLSIPGKLLVPSFFNDNSFAMLGLGDIVLPGLLLCFAMRFDREFESTIFSSSSLSRLTLTCKQWSYFTICVLGYSTGLITAGVMADWFRAAQPALLYLVPGVLLPLFTKAYLQGDLGRMWEGPFSRRSDGQKSGQNSTLLPIST